MEKVNSFPHDNVPHSSPAELQSNATGVVDRCVMTAAVSSSTLNSREALAPQLMKQPQAHVASVQMTQSPVTGTLTPTSLVHQIGNPQVPPPNYPHQQPSTSAPANIPHNNAASAMFRVQMWSNSYDSGVQSLNQSSAPSLISVSSLRAGSQISTLSDDAHSRIELNDQQQLKFENIPPNIGRGSQEGETRNAIPELIHLLNDSDEVVVQRAATMVQNIAKMDSEQPFYTEPLLRASELIPPLKELLRTRSNCPAIIKPTLAALFQISERRDGLESILRVNDQTKGELLIDIIHHIKFTGGSAIRYAILTFHTIIAEKTSNMRNIEIARANGALEAVTQFLDRETNEKLLSVIVECIRLLCDKNQAQRTMFFQLCGPMKLFNVLRNLRYEGLLWRTTQLLKAFSNADPQAIVVCGGYDILYKQLDHASQRLIISTLECIRNMSDVPTKDIDVSALLAKLLQLLGVQDPVVVLYCAGILSNLLANNQRNKEFLFERGGIPTLYRVLINSYNIHAATPNQLQRIEDIQERALATLRHLCVGHAHQADAQKAVLQSEYAAEFLLRKLTEMRPSILKQTLQILNKAALQDSNLSLLRDTFLHLSTDYDASFAERMFLILKVACEQLSSTLMIEEVRVAELIQLTLSTLQLMCRDPELTNQIAYFLRRQDYLLYKDANNSVMLPNFCLYQNYVEDENLKRSALGLISELANHPEIAVLYSSDTSLMSAFEHYSRSRNQAFATYAELAYQRCVQTTTPAYQMNMRNGVRPSMTVPTLGNAHYQPSYVPTYPGACPTANSGAYDYANQHTHYVDQPASSSASEVCSVHEGPSQTITQDIISVQYNEQQCSKGGTAQIFNMEYSSDSWPEDLSGLSISDDPFATIFCSQQMDSVPYSKLGNYQNRLIPGQSQAIRLNDEPSSLDLFCDNTLTQSDLMDYSVEAIHSGSPEAPASWNDPRISYNTFM